jgi:uncharacterized protein YjbJ (UPF0337 family)
VPSHQERSAVTPPSIIHLECRKAYVMTEGFRSSPAPTSDYPGRAAVRQEVTDTVQRIMGEDIAPPENHSPSTSGPIAAPGGADSTTGSAGADPGSDDSATADVAKAQAGQVADTAKQAGTQVAGTVKEQAGEVTAEAGKQAKELLAQAQSEVGEQAAATQQRVAEGLHALADELAGMASNSDQNGPATDLARQAADRAHQAAGWLADRDPGTLLDEVRSFARRKPGAYLAIALGAGVLAGRLTRGLTASQDDDNTSAAVGSTGTGADVSAAPLPSAAAQLDGSQPVNSPLGSTPPALGAVLPQTAAPIDGLGRTSALDDLRGEVTR